MNTGTGSAPVALPTAFRTSLESEELEGEVERLLADAGLTRNADGSFKLNQTDRVERVQANAVATEGRNQDVTGENAPLEPPAPPKVEWSAELHEAGLQFTKNLDLAINYAFMRDGATPPAGGDGPATDGTPPGEGPTGDGTPPDGATREGKTPDGKTPDGKPADGTTPATGPQTGGVEGAWEEIFRSIRELDAGALLAAFLKIGIEFPLNNPAVQEKLYAAMRDARQNSLKQEQDRIELARKEMERAEKKADKAGLLNDIITAIVAVIAVILTVISFGALGVLALVLVMAVGAALNKDDPLKGAAMGAALVASIASSGLVAILFAAVVAAGQIVGAKANADAGKAMNNAQKKENSAMTSAQQAEIYEELLEEQAAIMDMIMKSKNRTIEFMLQMMSALFNTTNIILNAMKV